MPEPLPTRALCFTSHHTNLRAAALIECLEHGGWMIDRPSARSALESVAQLLLSVIPNCWFALTRRGDIAIGFKPHVNVTLPLLICRLRGIPTWLDVDDLDHAYRDGWLGQLVEWSQRPFPKLFRTVSYHNPKLRDYLVERMRCPPERLVQVHQGVSCRAFGGDVSPETREQMRVRLGLQHRRVAVYTAHLNVASDLDAVLVAWQRVARQVPDAMLLVVGGGSRLAEYRALASSKGIGDHVVFVGSVSHQEIPAYFAAADVAVLYAGRRLANEYRCSLKLREYLAAGLRVCCNDVGELREFAPYTYQSGSDITHFANLLASLLLGHGDGREAAARDYARTHLDWPIVAATVHDEIMTRLRPEAAAAPATPSTAAPPLSPKP